MTFSCRIIRDNQVIYSDIDDLLFDEFSKLDTSENQSKKIEYKGNTYRIKFISSNDYKIYVASRDKDHIKSLRLFNTLCHLILENAKLASDFRDSYTKEIDLHVQRLIHNLITLNAQTSQLVYSIIPQDIIKSKKILGSQNWIDQMTKEVEDDIKEAALALVRIAKNSMQIKREIGVYEKLLKGDNKINIQQHLLHRIVLNIFYVFFPDFTDHGVKVNIQDSNENVFVDYETFQVALYYLLDNSVKYIKPNTDLLVFIKKINTNVSLVLEMISVKIDDGEEDKIFVEGYSGKYAIKSNKAGKGIGMAQAKKLLSYSNIDIKFKQMSLIDDIDENGVVYRKNSIILEFNKKRNDE